MGEVLKIVTPDGGIRKKNEKNFSVFFAKNSSVLRPFGLNFGLKDLFWAAQNVHWKKQKELEAHAKLLDVLSNDIMSKAKKRS